MKLTNGYAIDAAVRSLSPALDPISTPSLPGGFSQPMGNGFPFPVPYVDAHKAELLFRHKILRLLRDRELISQERIDLLLSWRNSGFSVHNRTTVYPDDTEGLHKYKLACYLMRAPVNLSRLRFDRDSGLLLYEPKSGHELDDDALTDPLEFLARVLTHIPEPNKHLVHSYVARRFM